MNRVRSKFVIAIFSYPLTPSHIVVFAKVLCQFYTPYFEKDVCKLERVERAAKFKKYDYQGKMENVGFD